MAFNSSRIKLLLESPAAAANDFEKCGRSSKSSLFILLQVFLATSGAQTNRTQHTHTHTHTERLRERNQLSDVPIPAWQATLGETREKQALSTCYLFQISKQRKAHIT